MRLESLFEEGLQDYIRFTIQASWQFHSDDAFLTGPSNTAAATDLDGRIKAPALHGGRTS